VTEPDRRRQVSELELRTLFEGHYRDVWRLLGRLGVPRSDLDDAAQEVFWVAARRLSDIKPGSEHAFLYGVALRVASNERRKLKGMLRRCEFDEHAIVSRAPSAEQALEGARARQLLDEVLAGMSPELRTVFVLYELERFEVREISELQGIPRGTASSRLRRARVEFSNICRRVRATLERGRRR
jgi:RNA polymerase sigma-70 factor (ECF subfamily)